MRLHSIPGHPGYFLTRDGTLWSDRELPEYGGPIEQGRHECVPALKYSLDGKSYSFKRLYQLTFPDRDWSKVVRDRYDYIMDRDQARGRLKKVAPNLWMDIYGQVWAEPDPTRLGLNKGWKKLRAFFRHGRAVVRYRLQYHDRDALERTAFPKGRKAARIALNQQNDSDIPED